MITKVVPLALFAAISALAADDDRGAIEGRVVDVTSSAIDAVVRVTPEGSGQSRRAFADRCIGNFQMTDLPPGSYTIHVWREGFGPKVIRDIKVLARETNRIGEIKLGIAGCEAPGVACDCFSAGCSAPVFAADSCKADFKKGTVECDPTRDRAADISLRTGERGKLYLLPKAGARFSSLDDESGCAAHTYSSTEIQIDNLGPGDDFCVQTAGHVSHVFLREEVPAGATEVRLWFATRPR